MRTLCSVLLLLVCAVGASAAPLRDRPAPEFGSLSWLGVPEGGSPRLADYRGRVLVVSVVGIDEDSPEMLRRVAAVQRPFIKDREVAFIAVHTGGGESAARATFKDTGLACPVALDPGGKRIAKPYGVPRTPWTIIIDGRSVVRFSGKFPGDAPLRRRIESWRPSSQYGGRIVGQAFGAPDGLRWLTRDGEPLRFEDHAFTLVRWWTDDCPHCAASIPALSTLWERYRERGLHMLAVYHPKRPRPTSDRGVRAYAKRLGYTGDMAYDRHWTKLKELMGRAGFRRATSVSFLVDRTGKIVWAHPGPRVHWSRDPRHRGADRDIKDLERRLQLWLPPR